MFYGECFLDCFASLAMTVITSVSEVIQIGGDSCFLDCHPLPTGRQGSFHSLVMTGRENWIATHLPVGKARFARNDSFITICSL